MKKEQMQEFALRVTQANRSELVVIMYEVILEDMKQARLAADSEEETDEYVKALTHASRFISELMATLDYQFALSYELRQLYIYANREVIRSIYSKRTEPLDAVERIISKLKNAFSEVSAQDTSGPVMQNTQQLTAGLTYGRGTLNEVCINANEADRGFRA